MNRVYKTRIIVGVLALLLLVPTSNVFSQNRKWEIAYATGVSFDGGLALTNNFSIGYALTPWLQANMEFLNYNSNSINEVASIGNILITNPYQRSLNTWEMGLKLKPIPTNHRFFLTLGFNIGYFSQHEANPTVSSVFNLDTMAYKSTQVYYSSMVTTQKGWGRSISLEIGGKIQKRTRLSCIFKLASTNIHGSDLGYISLALKLAFLI